MPSKKSAPNAASQSNAVNQRRITMTRDLGCTANMDHVTLPVVSVRTLESVIQPEQFVTKTHTEWVPGKPVKAAKGKKGMAVPMGVPMEPRQVTVRKDILDKARSHMGTMKLKHPATMGFRRRRMEEEAIQAGVPAREARSASYVDSRWGDHQRSPVTQSPLSVSSPLSGGSMKRHY